MTQNELKVKLDASEDKVNKRLNTISKLCAKANINKDELLAKYNDTVNKKDNYLRNAQATAIVDNFVDTTNLEWDSPVYQLIDNLTKLFEVEKIRDNWQVKYDIQKNKEDAPKVEAIWNFLCEWEQKVLSWYRENCERYFNLKKNYETAEKEFLNSEYYKDRYEKEVSSDYFKSYYRTEDNLKRHLLKTFTANYYEGIDNFTQDITQLKYRYEYPNPDYKWDYERVLDSYIIDEEKLTKTVAQEKLAKYEDLCNRISAVVGEITDASNLSIGNQNGELNGIVKGTKGSAKVETIGAAGYNIQRFHYRVLVHKIN